MGLLSDVRAYLQRVQTGETVTLAERSPIDRPALRRQILDAIPPGDSRASLLPTHADALVSELAQALFDVPELSSSGDRTTLLRDALDLTLALASDRRDGSASAKFDGRAQLTLTPLCRAVWSRFEARVWQQVPSERLYALELGLVAVEHDRPSLTALGKSFLRLTGKDAVRWVIATELLSSIDSDDPWRAHPTWADELLHNIPTILDPDDPALHRWAALGLLHPTPADVREGEAYSLTPLGVEVLRELLRDPDAPIKSAVRAILEDTRDRTINIPHRPGAAASVVRHTRMLAHEMRNALVPVRIQFEQLWQRLPRDDVRVALHRQHRTILAGLDRALQFVTDAARAVGPSEDDTSLFNLAGAVREACAGAQLGDAAAFATDIPSAAETLHLLGPRPRLVLAIVNLLRNAIQAGGPATSVRVALTPAAGHMAVLTVDDGGPGVPEALRDKLFTNGHTGHEHGTGHGLSLVREVVEEDFTGSVHHERSDLGGARFVLRFPIPSEAT